MELPGVHSSAHSGGLTHAFVGSCSGYSSLRRIGRASRSHQSANSNVSIGQSRIQHTVTCQRPKQAKCAVRRLVICGVSVDRTPLVTYLSFATLVAIFAKEDDMGFLDGILGGVIGAEALSLVKDYVEKHGGIQGVVAEFEKTGFGQQAKSWVSNGPNLPVTSEQIQQARIGKGEGIGREIWHSGRQGR
jgi:hypothetical protein